MAKLTKAELIVLKNVSIIDYYNDNVVGLKNKLRPDVSFRPMSLSKVTAICPFHGDSDPSFHYWGKKNIGHCFGCDWGGDVIKFHQSIRRLYYGENLDRKSATKSLAIQYGIDIPEEAINETQDVFKMARESLTNKEAYKIPKGVMSYAEFSQLNRRLINDKNIPENIKIKEFANLDMMAGLMYSGEVKLSEV